MGTVADGHGAFGVLLRHRRTTVGLSQEELAERSGLSVRAIRDMERGVTGRPRRSSVALLADALGLVSAERGELIASGRRFDVTGPPPEPFVPRQLPSAVGNFVGRTAELHMLASTLDGGAAGHNNVVVISAISGTAGVGKTALAVRWAHLAAERFPDGQLYVNLRGYDPGQPMPAADALAGFLRALGMTGQDIPPTVDERAARYRSLLAGRRMLVVLDNARNVGQVRPLLPGAQACAVVVTSRDSLAGLVAREGARRLDIDLLPLDDAVVLLRALIGGRVDADLDAAAALAAQCSRLPLALRVAAELAADRPAVPLGALVGELAGEQRQLDLLDAGGDPGTAVRAVFSWSYRHLDRAVARAFRLLGLHQGTDFDPHAAAALTGATAEQARHLLDQLARAYLIRPGRPGRYGMHDLLRAYARELTTDRDDAAERQEALTHLFDYYLSTAAAATDTLFPADRYRQPGVSCEAIPSPNVARSAAARAWLDAERASLVAVAAHTAAGGWPSHATRLAAVLFRYLDTGGHYPEALIVHASACRAARDAGDRAAEASALTNLGVVDVWQGRYQQAADHLQNALAVCREVGDSSGEARALHLLGNVAFQQGRYQLAVGQFQQSLDLYRQIGDQIEVARALGNLGVTDQRQGHYQQASDRLHQALILCQQAGDRFCEAHVLGNLGVVDRQQGRYEQANEHLRQALALFRETGNRTGEAHALTDLGDLGRREGHYHQAINHQRQALTLFREFGDRSGEAEALNGLGEIFLATGRHGHARAQHAIALGIASHIGDQVEEARAHNGLALAHQATGDAARARSHWQEALALYTSLGAPEADQVRARIATA